MAVDEMLLERARAGSTMPVLRLYAWDPACLSLGYGQAIEEVDRDRLKEKGWDLVRRATGGKAILHTDEMTYSVIGPRQDPRLAGSILASYLVLSGALASALKSLGLDVQIEPSGKPGPTEVEDGPVCFVIPSAHEITAGGRKLVGSAQSRKGGAMLQHGTIPLTGDLRRITEVLAYPDEQTRTSAGQEVLDRATTVARELGRAVSWDEMAGALMDSFESTLNLELIPSELGEDEALQVETLLAEKAAILSN
ncbi:MAG: lipoate--protein ligase family protein [Anaerolineales bacterium]|nr:lipoate--protein ligase family protein [Anaerolineales bacterium]